MLDSVADKFMYPRVRDGRFVRDLVEGATGFYGVEESRRHVGRDNRIALDSLRMPEPSVVSCSWARGRWSWREVE